MKFYIGKNDIKNGKRGDAYDCPIALAVKRKLKTDNVRVNFWSITINGTKYTAPRNAKEFIYNFDARNKVKPTTINIKNVELNEKIK